MNSHNSIRFSIVIPLYNEEHNVAPHFFGFLGLVASGTGSFIAGFLILKKLIRHQEILLQNGPLMIGAAVLILTGVQLLCLGLVCEILSRTYYESQKKPIYAARVIKSHEPQSTLALE